MRTKLKKLFLSSVDTVRAGANQEADICLFKSADGAEAPAQEIPIDDGKNVGIKNSIYRLKYYYGENASVVCESELNVGTTFIIAFPYDLEEK